MFTGIIEELGKIKKISRAGAGCELEVACSFVCVDVKAGDSIAVNGVCLTVTNFSATHFTADVSEETLRRSSLKNAFPGSVVNLERALQMGGRFGGHIVQGHVDATGQVLSVTREGEFWVFRVSIPERIRVYVAEKGSIAIDGISLTVAEDCGDSVTLAVIPHTYIHTNLSKRKPSDYVNIEVDLIARYTRKLLRAGTDEGRLEKMMLGFE